MKISALWSRVKRAWRLNCFAMEHGELVGEPCVVRVERCAEGELPERLEPEGGGERQARGVESPELPERGLDRGPIAAGDRAGERTEGVGVVGRLGERAAGELEVALEDDGIEADLRDQGRRGAQQGDHAAGREGGREMVSPARGRGDLDGPAADRDGEPPCERAGRGVAVDAEDRARGGAELGEAVREGLERVQGADRAAVAGERRQGELARAARGVEDDPRRALPWLPGEGFDERRQLGVRHGEEQQLVAAVEVGQPLTARAADHALLLSAELLPPARQAAADPAGTDEAEAKIGQGGGWLVHGC
jgi:hypothetical protein